MSTLTALTTQPAEEPDRQNGRLAGYRAWFVAVWNMTAGVGHNLISFGPKGLYDHDPRRSAARNRPVGLLLAAGGELLAVPLAVTLGVGAFFLALAGLLVSMTLTLLTGLTRLSGPDMRAPSVTDRRG